MPEMPPGQAGELARIGELLQRGRFQEAAATCLAVLAAAPGQPTATHLLGLSHARMGRRAEAEPLLRRSLELDPGNAQFHTNFANFLRRGGRSAEAEREFRTALGIEPHAALAQQDLGSLLIDTDRAEEAMQALARAQALGAPPFELSFGRGRALTLLYRLDEAEQALLGAIALRPRHIDAQMNLARLRFMRADPHFTRDVVAAIAAAPQDLRLQALQGTLLFRAGKYQDAEAHLRDVMRVQGPLPQFRGLLAQVLFAVGRLDAAEHEALEAAGSAPRNSELVDLLVSILLSRGRARDALPFIRTQRSREPEVQGWIAHEDTAARLLGQPLYKDLFDYPRFVRACTPEAPPGWSSMRELNDALLTALTARHRLTSQSLDQSLRNGSRTTRNLVADPDPAIVAIMRSFEEPIRSYLREIGGDPAHPFTARRRQSVRIDAAWSVQLRRGGLHANHIHSKGWISSAYYAAVPAEVDDIDWKAGWLKFGEPRHPVPGLGPDQYVQPKAGLLVLFPSYLWHGTNAIQGAETRTTVAFDAVPGA